MQFPIRIGLRRSFFLDCLLFCVAFSVAGVAWFFPGPLFLRLAAPGLAGLLALVAWRQLSPQLSEIRLERGGRIALLPISSPQGYIDAVLLPGAVVHPWLTIVRFSDEGAQPYMLIASLGSMKAEDFRRLRVFLRWQAGFSEPGDAV